jgi:hypothetical protein
MCSPGALLAALICLISLYLPGIATAQQADDCVVRDFTLADGITRRMPINRLSGKIIAKDVARIHAFIALDCTRAAKDLTFVFSVNNRVRTTVQTKLKPARRWRSWAWAKTEPGAWSVSVFVGDRLLVKEQFTVE